ncbi:hypothetical protein HON22_04425 [Candidatus Peregrinibacteria bacterium]|jgi:hypothetical protein|nr:hypothetical protein [Candidatus Peregrinibacteria bacterium]
MKIARENTRHLQKILYIIKHTIKNLIHTSMNAEAAKQLGNYPGQSKPKPLPIHPWEIDPKSILKNINERKKTLMLLPDEKPIEPADIIPFRSSK